MTAAIGFPTLRLVRHAVGEWALGDLAPGEWRSIDVEPPSPQRDAGARRAFAPRGPAAVK